MNGFAEETPGFAGWFLTEMPQQVRGPFESAQVTERAEFRTGFTEFEFEVGRPGTAEFPKASAPQRSPKLSLELETCSIAPRVR
jgi:hypothetical protein